MRITVPSMTLKPDVRPIHITHFARSKVQVLCGLPEKKNPYPSEVRSIPSYRIKDDPTLKNRITCDECQLMWFAQEGLESN